MLAPLFLTTEELVTLTGRHQAPAQIAALRKMAVAFRVNAAGKPVVTRDAVTGGATAPAAAQWQPRALRAA